MQKLCLLLVLLLANPLYGQELLIATTLSTQATAHIIAQWQHANPSVTVKTLNRTSNSIERLVYSPFSDKIDLIISSSPMLLSHLQTNNMLSPLAPVPKESQLLIPAFLQHYAAAFAYSGSGILSNQQYLKQHHLPLPQSWQDLTRPEYYGTVSMSAPSRSDTTHIMIELLLQEYGWQKGWQIMLEIGGNIGTISSRSFGVADKINAELSIIGITIDNYARLNSNDKLVFHHFPHNVPIPTFVTILQRSQHKEAAQRFIDYLFSTEGQLAVSHPNTGKYPILPLTDHVLSNDQADQFHKTAQIDYERLLQRQALIRQLFDIAITFRLAQLHDSWQLLHETEKKLGKRLPEVRQILTAMPLSEAESLPRLADKPGIDAQTDYQINAIAWKTFFQQQNQLALKLLETL